MVHGFHDPSLIIDVAIFGTTLGCINIAFFQWLKSKKKSDKKNREKRDNPL